MRLDHFTQDLAAISGRIQRIEADAEGGPLEIGNVMEHLAQHEVYALECRDGKTTDLEFTVDRLGLEPDFLGGRIRIELTRRASAGRELRIFIIIVAALVVVGVVLGGLTFAYQAGQRSVVTNTQLPTE